MRNGFSSGATFTRSYLKTAHPTRVDGLAIGAMAEEFWSKKLGYARLEYLTDDVLQVLPARRFNDANGSTRLRPLISKEASVSRRTSGIPSSVARVTSYESE